MFVVNLIEKAAVSFRILRHNKMSKVDWSRWGKINGNKTWMLIFSMDKVWTSANKNKI
jgi:hypothetical protein